MHKHFFSGFFLQRRPNQLPAHATVSVLAICLFNNNNNNNNTYIALIRMRSKRFTSIVLQYDLEI